MLLELIKKALDLNAYELEVEYKNREERVTAMRGLLGFGIGSVPANSPQSEQLLIELDALKQSKLVTIGELVYRAAVSEHESFGEWAYRIKLTKLKRD